MKYTFAISGPDRCGKATQSKKLVEYLQSLGYSAVRVEVPYNDGITYKWIYAWLKNGWAKSYPTLFQVVQFINKLCFQLFVLPKLQKQYDVVVFDRWKLSNIVYGIATGVSPKFVNFLAKRLVEPDLTFVLSTHSHGKEQRDVYEKDTELQQRVRTLYDEYTVEHLNAVCVDATGPIEHVAFIIQTHINFFLLDKNNKLSP